MAKKKLSILLLCDKYYNLASTVHDHIDAISNSRHSVFVLDSRKKIPSAIKLEYFDVVVIHYSLVMCSTNYIPKETSEKIRKFSGLKACFIQDEYRFINDTVNALKFLGMHLIFTCVPPSEFEKVYPQSILEGVRCVNVLTGCVPKQLLQKQVPSYQDRPIDVSYRGRALPFWLGSLAQDKSNIAKIFKKDAVRFNLITDIEYLEEARIYKNKWIEFLMSSKACLGVESGASVFDFTGEIESNIQRHLKSDPSASFELISKLYLEEYEGKIKLNQISPRCFEAASLRTLMILYEGEYSNILVPWRHYVPLKKDHSNMQEVVDALRNVPLAEKIISQAYKEVALNKSCSYDYLTEVFDRSIEEQIIKMNVRNPKVNWVYRSLVMRYARLSVVAYYYLHPFSSLLKKMSSNWLLFLRRICPTPLKKLIKAALLCRS
jgi:hypothetical protein